MPHATHPADAKSPQARQRDGHGTKELAWKQTQLAVRAIFSASGGYGDLLFPQRGPQLLGLFQKLQLMVTS